MTRIFSDAMEAALARGASLDALLDVVRAHRDAGLPQRDAYEALARLRSSSADDGTADLLLELMDVVAGWYQPRSGLWSAPLTD